MEKIQYCKNLDISRNLLEISQHIRSIVINSEKFQKIAEIKISRKYKKVVKDKTNNSQPFTVCLR